MPYHPPSPILKDGANFIASAQLIHVVACFALCTAFLVLPLLPPFAGCILGSYTTAMASMFMKWRKPEAALPWSGLGVSNRKACDGQFEGEGKMPLHAMAKAAAFSPFVTSLREVGLS